MAFAGDAWLQSSPPGTSAGAGGQANCMDFVVTRVLSVGWQGSLLKVYPAGL